MKKLIARIFHKHEWRIKRRGARYFKRCQTCGAERFCGKDAA